MSGGYPCCCGDDIGGGSSGSSAGSSSSLGSSGTIGTVGCSFCQDGVVAEYYQVEISGIAEHTDCADCADLDGVYIVGPVQQTFLGGDPADCSDAILIATVCDEAAFPDCYGQLLLQFYRAGGDYRLNVNFQTGATDCGEGGGQPRMEWEKNFGTTAPDCLLDHESIPFLSNGVPGTERCDASGAICTVTAIPAP